MIFVNIINIHKVIIFDLLMPNKYKKRRLNIYRIDPEIKLLE